jgi:hypothetical protein
MQPHLEFRSTVAAVNSMGVAVNQSWCDQPPAHVLYGHSSVFAGQICLRPNPCDLAPNQNERRLVNQTVGISARHHRCRPK